MQTLHRLFFAGLLVLLAAGTAPARELAMDPQDMVPVELASVGINPQLGAPVVLLRDTLSGDVVPIFIGVPEAQAILAALHDVEPLRPMTHDLLKSVLDATGATLSRVFVDQLRDNTYFGMLELEVAGGDPILVDSRPSDALALAARTGASILVAPEVLVASEGLEYEGLAQDQVVSALGVTVVAATPDFREALELPPRPGLLVRRSLGRAAEAGLQAGSLILTVNGQVPEEPMDFLELIRGTAEGEMVHVTFWLDGEEHTIELPADLAPVDSQREGTQVEI